MPISKLTFIRSTLLAMLVGGAALIAIVGVNIWLVGQTRTYSETLNRARQQRTSVSELRSALQDAETGQRGYLLTNNRSYLEPYTDAQSKLSQMAVQLRQAASVDPEIASSAARLSALIDAKLAELRQTIELAEGGRRDDAIAIVNSDRGRNLMDQARAAISTLLDHEEGRISDAVEGQQESIEALRWVTIGGALVIFLVVGGSVWAVMAYTQQLIAAEREVQSLNAGLEERVRERTTDLRRANDEIQRFAYVVTHDLRAPLVNIMGFTSELEGSLNAIRSYMERPDGSNEDQITEDARQAALEDLPEAIGFIRSSTRKMDGLINAILKLSREGRRVLKPERINLEQLLQTASANVAHQVGEAGGNVSIDGVAPPVVSDRLALEQVFGNLLDNAVKYRSPARPLQVQIRMDQEFGQRIVVEIKDNGRGIARQDHERVFELFRRSGSQDTPGEGIGLAHVRSMVRNLGGDVTLESELDRGTTFKVTFPRDLRKVMKTTQTVGAA